MSEAIFVPVAERLRERARYYRSKGLDSFASELEAEALNSERIGLFGAGTIKRRQAVVATPTKPTPQPLRAARPGEERWVSINQACALAGVSRRTIYNWLDEGKLKVKRTIGGSPRILESSLWEAPR